MTRTRIACIPSGQFHPHSTYQNFPYLPCKYGGGKTSIKVMIICLSFETSCAQPSGRYGPSASTRCNVARVMTSPPIIPPSEPPRHQKKVAGDAVNLSGAVIGYGGHVHLAALHLLHTSGSVSLCSIRAEKIPATQKGQRSKRTT